MGRRSRGESSIYKRKDGRWCGKYTDANGKMRYVYGRTKGDVRVKLTKAIAEKDKGIVYDAGTLTVGEYLDKWLASIEDSLRPGAFCRYEEASRIHVKPTLGKVRLSRLNTLQLQNLYRTKLDEGLSARTVQIIHATAHKALKQTVRWQLVPVNVAQAATPPRQVKREIDPLSKEQVKTLLDAAKGDKLHALYVLAVTTEMRQGEIIGLQWKDIDLEAETLRVSRSVFNGKISPPKTTSGRRTIRLSKMAIRALKRHRVSTARQRISEWVFSTGKGTPLSCHNLHNRSWKPLLRKAGLSHSTRLHDLQHSCISLLLARGIPVKVVSEMAGHAIDKVQRALRDGPAYVEELARMTGLAPKTVQNALTELRRLGEVKPTGERRGQAEQVCLVSSHPSAVKDKGGDTEVTGQEASGGDRAA